jgi:hypothetical protein
MRVARDWLNLAGSTACAAMLLTGACGGRAALTPAASDTSGDSGVPEAGTPGSIDASPAQTPPDCVDIRVSPAAIGKEVGTLFTQDSEEQRRFWRDASGIHVFWSYINAGPDSGTMLTTFDAANGQFLNNRVFDGGVLGVAVGESGRIGAAYVTGTAEAPELGLLLLQMDDPTFQVLVPISDGYMDVGVGWDGEAFVVEGFPKTWAIGYQYLARVLPDGTILSPPAETDYEPLGRTATNPSSGLSVSVAGWLGASGIFSAHTRDGQVLASAAPFEPLGLQPEASPLGGAVEWFADGALIAWSGNPSITGGHTTYVQPVGADAAPSDLCVTFPPTQIGPDYRGNALTLGYRWLTVQPLGSGVWAAGAYNSYLDEMIADASGALTRVLVSSSHDETWSDFRQLQSARWNDEVWAGFHETTSDLQVVFRIVRASNGCSYSGLARQ